MIKVLLADDDFLVRTFLSRITDWEKHGYKLVGAAQDGEEALRMAKEYVDTHTLPAPLITINSWNEWTEMSYLEPDDVYGYGYLEAIRRVFCE